MTSEQDCNSLLIFAETVANLTIPHISLAFKTNSNDCSQVFVFKKTENSCKHAFILLCGRQKFIFHSLQLPSFFLRLRHTRWENRGLDFGARHRREASFNLVGHVTMFGCVFRDWGRSNGPWLVAKGNFHAPSPTKMLIATEIILQSLWNFQGIFSKAQGSEKAKKQKINNLFAKFSLDGRLPP